MFKLLRSLPKENLSFQRHTFENSLLSPYLRTSRQWNNRSYHVTNSQKTVPKWVQWGLLARNKDFQKKLNKGLIVLYIGFFIYGTTILKKIYFRDAELGKLEKKLHEGKINEFEMLKIKEIKGQLRTRDEEKLKRYYLMQKEHHIENFDNITLDVPDQNKINESILPARDTTPFYDSKAEKYDKEINFEEKMIWMGRRRKWLVKRCQGDVLEVSCGTGRNIPYMKMEKIKSITFLDSSNAMMEVAVKKFRDRFPSFKKAAFVVGHVEDLPNLVENKEQVKYDSIIEAFGLCSHKDPVAALKNMALLLKPNGRIYMLEHGRGTNKTVNKFMDKRAKKRLETWGCRWNLDIGEILDDSGLEIVSEKRYNMGTTCCIVAKKRGDHMKKEEGTFFQKYIGDNSDKSLTNKNDNGQHVKS